MTKQFCCPACGTKFTTDKPLPCELTVDCKKCKKKLTVKLSDTETEVSVPYTDDE